MKNSFILYLFFSANTYSRVYLIKQWHLQPHLKTLDIEKGKQLPQYLNQKRMFLFLKDLINKKELEVLKLQKEIDISGSSFKTIGRFFSCEVVNYVRK